MVQSRILSQKPIKRFCGRHNCRVCRNRHIQDDLTNHFVENTLHRDRGGYFFQITLTVPHSTNESFSEIYPKFIKSISNFKKGPKSKGWRKVQELTECQYHTDNIECHQTDNGYHIHNHITLCGFKNPPIQTIYKELYNSWKYYTRKNGFRPISKKG